MISSALLSSFFDSDIDSSDFPPYFTLGTKAPTVGTAAMDSSDQSVVSFDEVTSVAACRSGINIVGQDQEVIQRLIGEIIYDSANPNAPIVEQLRVKLAIE